MRITSGFVWIRSDLTWLQVQLLGYLQNLCTSITPCRPHKLKLNVLIGYHFAFSVAKKKPQKIQVCQPEDPNTDLCDTSAVLWYRRGQGWNPGKPEFFQAFFSQLQKLWRQQWGSSLHLFLHPSVQINKVHIFIFRCHDLMPVNLLDFSKLLVFYFYLCSPLQFTV